MNSKTYSIENVFLGLTQSLYQYLEAQYHIRDEAILGERKRLLETAGVTYQVPRLEATPFYALGKPYKDMLIPSAAREVLDAASKLNIGIYQSPFLHQARAIEAFLGENSQDIIVATGTGSGKTESFLMPILGSLALEPEISMQSAKLPGCRAILLYPMNALVNDQLSRLRRLLGNADLAALLSKKRERLIRFGMYTGRTPYPGNASSEKDGERLSPLFDKLFNNVSKEIRVLLESEGKWPAKNMHQFAARAFATGEEDRELYTRHEMQRHCPDLLVTNYSMLEYMLLRPIESSIFDQTTTWLHSDRRNSLIVVLDEAHMYRGAAGAEVAMLLRRLQSRLQVDRSQLRYILTSASLGSSEEASDAVIKFAADLTGLESGKSFQLITSELEEIEVFAVATVNEIQALSTVNVEDIHACATDFRRTQIAINEFMRNLGHPFLQCENEAKLKDEIFGFLRKFGPAGLLSKTITGHPETFDHIAEKIFQGSNQANKALESLVAICNFARRIKDDRVFLPVRMHVMFRGLSGIFACSNPECSYKVKIKGSTYLGRLFDSPRLHCECGARVYELLTHRDCGAAFLRGYMRNENDDFLWHESTKLPRPGNNELLEAHFLVEVDRDRAQSADHIWLHISTGKISRFRPSNLNGYLPLIQPQSIFDAHGNRIVTFDRECPVCLRTWRDETKIMDLATKGEAPFAHLVKTQVRLQPPTKERSFRFPNQGRKCLLFSDGRQKAARLARDIPREVERDVFRQAIILAVRDLQNRVHGGEARLDPPFLYSSFLNIVSRFSLNLFDGKDSDALKRNAEEFKRDFSNDLVLAIENYFSRQPPLQYSAHLLRLLGNPFYSVHALTIAHVVPTRIAQDVLSKSGLGLSEIELKVLASVWIQSLLDRFAFDDMLGDGVRVSAAGYGSNSWGQDQGISGRRRKVITSILGDFANAEQVLETHLATRKNGFLFLKPDKLKLELALNKEWFQCQDCTYVTIGVLRGQCVNCGSNSVNSVNPETSDYLRARKTFWRDPIVAMLEGKEEPFHLDVQEHTAQLSHRDTDDPTSTTEEYERRFRDILVHEDDTPIDVLSSTTTMEVGIDIGSLVAVGLRNVPPMRQNYQQRAGRAGRRGSAVSTVITYAQNSPHDHYYFSNPEKIIAGEPPLPSIDIRNPRIIKRHVHAVLLQTYFHEQIGNLVSSSNIFSVLGDTWDFYNSNGPFSISAFNEWINNGGSENIYLQIQKWIPGKVVFDSKSIAGSFVNELESLRPTTKEQLIGQSRYLIEFLFEKGLLPSYAFPRDLCALQIEQEQIDQRKKNKRIKIIEKPQQSLNVALSEYAPGRLVVVNKKTYRVGTVTASSSANTVDRSTELFVNARHYIHCPDCFYTHTYDEGSHIDLDFCPLCGGSSSQVIKVIQPEVVFPENGKEIDELDDDQVISTVTAAQLPVVELEEHFKWTNPYSKGSLASAENQLLVMFNKGEQNSSAHGGGFLVCDRCGKAILPSVIPNGSHDRDYKIELYPTQRHPGKCNGQFQHVFLGYSFRSDVLLFRVRLTSPFNTHIARPIERRPLEDALTSLADSLLLSAARLLDIDVRELNSGFRFLSIGGNQYADLYIYDTLAGGAGYAHMAAEQFSEVVTEAEKLLKKCSCQSSCDKCLRHYGNRTYHASLDRYLALDLLDYIKTGKAPELKTLSEQTNELSQLAKILELAGWSVTVDGPNAPMTAKQNGKETHVATYPALTDPVELPHPLLGKAVLLSSYELKQDLPGAFVRVQEV